MNLEFHWSPQPSLDDQERVENDISGILQDRDIKPCHLGAISVLLGIGGPLNNELYGSAKCQCRKVLMTFKGNSDTMNLEIEEFE